MKQREFIVKEDQSGKRLDIYLSLNNNDLSRTFIKKNIESDNVTVNGEVEYRANYSVQAGDSIILKFELDDEKELTPQNIPLKVVYEDDNLVVINKDSGMSVHPMNYKEKGTVVNALIYKYQNMRYIGNSIRTGLIHRLDKGTSGVLLVGKTNLGLWHYSKQFAERNVDKYYLAVSTGRLENRIKKKSPVTVENFLGRNPKNRKKFSVLDSSKGKYAKSEIYYVDSSEDKHLFVVKPYTGRTHQIRIHLASLGMPILGDRKYGGMSYDRLMLHAWRLSTINLDGERVSFKADAPEEFNNLFKDIDNLLDDYETI